MTVHFDYRKLYEFDQALTAWRDEFGRAVIIPLMEKIMNDEKPMPTSNPFGGAERQEAGFAHHYATPLHVPRPPTDQARQVSRLERLIGSTSIAVEQATGNLQQLRALLSRLRGEPAHAVDKGQNASAPAGLDALADNTDRLNAVNNAIAETIAELEEQVLI